MLKLKAILEEKGISQRKLARLLLVSPAVITNLVNHGLLIKTGTEQFKTRLTEVLKTLGISTALSELLMEDSAGAATPAEDSPNLDEQSITTEEDTMLLAKQALFPATKKHFSLFNNPFTDEVRSAEEVFSSPDVRYVREALFQTARFGGFMAVVGESGAGKSTIVNLLLRFYEPQSGQICIDGQNIDSVTQESLRAQIGLVTQDTSLLHRSVRDNIVYGRPDATEEDMLQAARRAEAAEFIPQLSDAKGRKGYDAHVGERGVKLSGGQRQRIAIARVMLKDAPILLLDEATSALDSEVEAAIQESLDTMMEGKTVIAIAHRLSTIAAMDRLIVLDKGRIVEEGNHAELLAKGGLYASLWAHQSGGFLNVKEPEAGQILVKE